MLHYSVHHKAAEEEGDPEMLRKRHLGKEMRTVGFRYSWKKMEVEAEDRWMETSEL